MQLCSLTICFLAYQTELETVDLSSLHQELLWHSSSKKCSRVQVASVYSSHRYSSHCLTELCTRVPGRWSHPLQEWIPVIYSTLSSGKPFPSKWRHRCDVGRRENSGRRGHRDRLTTSSLPFKVAWSTLWDLHLDLFPSLKYMCGLYCTTGVAVVGLVCGTEPRRRTALAAS